MLRALSLLLLLLAHSIAFAQTPPPASQPTAAPNRPAAQPDAAPPPDEVEEPGNKPIAPPAGHMPVPGTAPGPAAAAAAEAAYVADTDKGANTDAQSKSALPRSLRTRVVLFRHGPFTIRMAALLQIQGAFYVGKNAARQFNDPADSAGFRIRRARIAFSGRLFSDFSYYLAFTLKDAIGGATGDKGNEILDARLLWDRWSFLNISIGVDRAPFSIFQLMSSTRLNLIERPLSVTLMGPGRRVGSTVLGRIGHFQYAAGVYNGSTGVTTGNRLAGISSAARIRYDVFDPIDQFVPRKLQLAFAGAYMFDNQAALTMHSASGSFDWQWFGVRLMGEFLYSRSKPKAQPQGKTTDVAPVERWSAIAELSAFVWSKYLQIAGRYEYFHDNVALPTFGKQQLITAGINGYLYEEQLKLQFAYTRRDELQGPGLDNDIAYAQLQGMF